MMHSEKSTEYYYMNKMALLTQLLGTNEEFLSNLGNWESCEEYLLRRDDLIQELQGLDESYGNEVIASCTTSQKSELDRMLNLILAVDKDITASMHKERQEALSAMKATVKEKKITGYENPVTVRGQLLDYKR